MEMKEKVIEGLQKDNHDLRAVVKDKDDTIRLMTRQLMEGEARIERLEADLKFAKALADLHERAFHKAISISASGSEAPCR